MKDSVLSSHADYIDFYARQGLQIYYPRAMIMSLDSRPAVQVNEHTVVNADDEGRRPSDRKRLRKTTDEEMEHPDDVFIVVEYRYKHTEARNNTLNDSNKVFQLVGVYTKPLKANVKAMRYFAGLCGEKVFVEDCAVKRLTPSEWIHQHLRELTACQSSDQTGTHWKVTENGLLELLGRDEKGWVKIIVQQRLLDEGLY